MEETPRLIYLDYNATTPPDPRVVDRLRWSLEVGWGNPSSTHAVGLAARDIVQSAREQVAELLGLEPSRIVFTSGGTEANALALWSAWNHRPPGRNRLVISAVEHPSVLEAARGLPAPGADVVLCPVDHTGRVNLQKLTALCTRQTALVAVMQANNEIGAIQPAEEVISIARQAGALVLCDAIQAVGKVPVRFDELGPDYLSVSGHKVYGPKGVGCLCLRPGAPARPVFRGSSQERGVRPGTENVPGIVGFGEACRLAREHGAEMARVCELRDRLQQRLVAEAGAVVVGDQENRLPNTLGALFDGVDARALLLRLSRRGVALSAGSACHGRTAEPSHVLRAMGIPADAAFGFVRISLGLPTTSQEIELGAEAIVREVDELRRLGGGKRQQRSAR